MLLGMALGVIQGGPHPGAVPYLAAELHRALVRLVIDSLLRAIEGLVIAVLGALLSAGEGGVTGSAVRQDPLVILTQNLIAGVEQRRVLSINLNMKLVTIKNCILIKSLINK